MGENKRKHLEFIQSAVGNMNANSRHIKTWCVTLLAALGAIYSTHPSYLIIVVACAVVIIFWGLDSYYLRMERRFKKLYHEVARKREEDIDFSMREWRINESFWNAFLSKVERRFYMSILLILIIVGSLLVIFEKLDIDIQF